VQIKITVTTPVLHLAITVLTDTTQVADMDASNILLNTPFNDVFRQGMEEMGPAFRLYLVKTSCLVTAAVVAFGDLLWESSNRPVSIDYRGRGRLLRCCRR